MAVTGETIQTQKRAVLWTRRLAKRDSLRHRQKPHRSPLAGFPCIQALT